MLEELKKIRTAVEPKPAPPLAPPAVPKGFVQKFTAFLNKYGIIGLAIAVIIGGAAGRLVSALVSDILIARATCNHQYYSRRSEPICCHSCV